MSDRKRAISKLDTAFSKWVRLRGAWKVEATENGLTQEVWVNHCFTCGKVLPIKQMDAGHYISRGKLHTRFDKDNVHPQCKNCNMPPSGKYPFGKAGNLQEYARKLVKIYNAGILEELHRRSRSQTKIPTYYLEQQIDFYKTEVKKIEKGAS